MYCVAHLTLLFLRCRRAKTASCIAGDLLLYFFSPPAITTFLEVALRRLNTAAVLSLRWSNPTGI